MFGISQYQSQINGRIHNKRNERGMDDARDEVIKAIKRLAGMGCFASEISNVCPEIYCHWRDDCFRLSN